ncbi:hypothetical protein LCGC14_3037830 [marine sediment metagenome]|uniref:Uncharacterized protein n=1 Tax=marine sediment metagenome TaxID=412755 RepID=A0A0F8YYG5_9ZZZZ
MKSNKHDTIDFKCEHCGNINHVVVEEGIKKVEKNRNTLDFGCLRRRHCLTKCRCINANIREDLEKEINKYQRLKKI